MAMTERATAEANWYALSADDVVARVGVDAERGLILIKGAIPGAKGGLVVLRSAAKKGDAA